jgi:hypothetical protein
MKKHGALHGLDGETLGIPIHMATWAHGRMHRDPETPASSAMEKHTNQTFHIFDARDFTQPFVLLSRL